MTPVHSLLSLVSPESPDRQSLQYQSLFLHYSVPTYPPSQHYGLECVGFDTTALPSSDDILRKAFWVRIWRHCRNDLHSFGLQQGRILWPI